MLRQYGFPWKENKGILIIETTDLGAFGYLMGYLRESRTLAAPYFQVKELVIGVPNNFRGSMDIKDVLAA